MVEIILKMRIRLCENQIFSYNRTDIQHFGLSFSCQGLRPFPALVKFFGDFPLETQPSCFLTTASVSQECLLACFNFSYVTIGFCYT